jgi:hypothetical protein
VGPEGEEPASTGAFGARTGHGPGPLHERKDIRLARDPARSAEHACPAHGGVQLECVLDARGIDPAAAPDDHEVRTVRHDGAEDAEPPGPGVGAPDGTWLEIVAEGRRPLRLGRPHLESDGEALRTEASMKTEQIRSAWERWQASDEHPEA